MSTLRRNEKLCGGLRMNFRVMSWLTGLLICVLPVHLGSESLTLSTYYPAPLGVYSELVTTGKTILARDWDGPLGIGTSKPFPTSKLHVHGGPIYVSDEKERTKAGKGNAGIFIEGSRILDKGDGIMRIRSSGNVIAFDDADNVGIGTTSPTTNANPNGDTTGNLDVNDVWLRGANSGTGRWASEAGGSFGVRETRALYTLYQAATDGFLYGSVIARGIPAESALIYVDPSRAAVTARAAGCLMQRAGEESGNATQVYHSFTVPVRKNDYYRITTENSPLVSIYWTPVGE